MPRYKALPRGSGRASPTINRYVTVGSEVAVIRHDGVNQQGQLHFYIKTGGTFKSIRVDNVLETGKWYHVAGTWDSTTMKLYLNGELVGQSTPGGTLNVPDGTVSISRSDEAMDGYIDDVRIWNDARTPTEIRENMHKYLGGSEAGLEHYWKLDESSGSTAYDSDNTGSVDLGNARKIIVPTKRYFLALLKDFPAVLGIIYFLENP